MDRSELDESVENVKKYEEAIAAEKEASVVTLEVQDGVIGGSSDFTKEHD